MANGKSTRTERELATMDEPRIPHHSSSIIARGGATRAGRARVCVCVSVCVCIFLSLSPLLFLLLLLLFFQHAPFFSSFNFGIEMCSWCELARWG